MKYMYKLIMIGMSMTLRVFHKEKHKQIYIFFSKKLLSHLVLQNAQNLNGYHGIIK